MKTGSTWDSLGSFCGGVWEPVGEEGSCGSREDQGPAVQRLCGQCGPRRTPDVSLGVWASGMCQAEGGCVKSLQQNPWVPGLCGASLVDTLQCAVPDASGEE